MDTGRTRAALPFSLHFSICFSSVWSLRACLPPLFKTLFPLERQAEEETDEDEDLAANGAQLAEWDNLELGNGKEFQGFEGVNPGGLENDSLSADDGQGDNGDLVISLPTPR